MAKTEEAYLWIKEQIICGKLPPLASLSEEELQQQLGMSRTPVREALLRLQQDGLVRVFPRKGMIVAELSQEIIREAFEMRLLIEPAVAAGAVPYLSREWLEDIRRRMTDPPPHLTGEQRRQYFIALDDELHSRIAEASPNRFLKRAMGSLFDQNRRLRYAASYPDAAEDHTTQEHLAILDAFLAADAAEVERLSLAHLRHAKELTMARLR